MRPYSILNRRRTTINHAFASSVAVVEEYDRGKVAEAIKELGQDPDLDLFCVYCGKTAQTWDHLRGLVKRGSYSGFGHTISNLVPCCDKCNSQEANRDWLEFLKLKNSDDEARFQKRFYALNAYSKRQTYSISYEDIRQMCPEEVRSLESAKQAIVSEMEKADKIAGAIRTRISKLDARGVPC